MPLPAEPKLIFNFKLSEIIFQSKDQNLQISEKNTKYELKSYFQVTQSFSWNIFGPNEK